MVRRNKIGWLTVIGVTHMLLYCSSIIQADAMEKGKEKDTSHTHEEPVTSKALEGLVRKSSTLESRVKCICDYIDHVYTEKEGWNPHKTVLLQKLKEAGLKKNIDREQFEKLTNIIRNFEPQIGLSDWAVGFKNHLWDVTKVDIESPQYMCHDEHVEEKRNDELSGEEGQRGSVTGIEMLPDEIFDQIFSYIYRKHDVWNSINEKSQIRLVSRTFNAFVCSFLEKLNLRRPENTREYASRLRGARLYVCGRTPKNSPLGIMKQWALTRVSRFITPNLTEEELEMRRDENALKFIVETNVNLWSPAEVLLALYKLINYTTESSGKKRYIQRWIEFYTLLPSADKEKWTPIHKKVTKMWAALGK